jgi:formylglycine-generating enzyme required for sulfatase activity
MIPKTKKLFISYRSSDHLEVDDIAEQLQLLKHEDGIRKYITWQDKHNLEAGKSWWDGIVDAIIDCDMFVFHLSPDYLDSAVCLAELNYAVERGRPIIPVVLGSAYYINPHTKKPDIDFWQDVPGWLGKYQFLFYDDDDFFDRFERAVAVYEANWPQDIEIRRPLNPDANAVHGNNYAVYATATERALQVAFEEAKPLLRELVQRNDRDFAEICRQWLMLLDRYQDLLDAKRHRAPRQVFQDKWDDYVGLFPLDFIDDLYPDSDDHPIIFDPKNLSKQRPKRKKPRQSTSTSEVVTPQADAAPPQSVVTSSKPTSISLMPAPFDWIEIPKKGYSIAKYPITNAQYAKFIEAGGYKQQKWWTQAGWEAKAKGWAWNSSKREWEETGKAWTEPRYWTDSQWNGAEQPVVGVSWYEAVAFCLWLCDATGEKIMLPTEDQWQYAAQGDDGRVYPWGTQWDNTKCNNSVSDGMFGFLKNKPKGHGKHTTPVTAYEKVGRSPFGVVDMAGNVCEWCLTDYEDGTNNFNSVVNSRVLRGGSWDFPNTNGFRCDLRGWAYPHVRDSSGGFRVSRS